MDKQARDRLRALTDVPRNGSPVAFVASLQRNELRALLDALDAAEQRAEAAERDAARDGAGWQRIQTAPRDGRGLLLSWGQDGVSQAKYVPGIPHPWLFIDTNDGITWMLNRSIDGPGGPSHWMPMPAPWRPARSLDAAIDAERGDQASEGGGNG